MTLTKPSIPSLNVLALTLIAASPLQAAFNESPPVTGAYESGQYRNLFQEIGKSSIDQRVAQTFNTMFYGNDNEKLFYEFDSDESYIKTIDTNDVRSEGMSWGMMIAVQMNKKDEFDKLWRFAYQRMRNTDGTYAWQAKDNGDGTVTVLDSGAAPDGEEYFATALFNAAARWGNGSGVLNYQAHANELLDTIRTHLIHPTEKQIVFAPVGDAAQITDPSYHIPAFYQYWADVADSHNHYWQEVADTSRLFLNTHLNHNNGNGGLATYLANFDGSASIGLQGLANPGNIYEGDAWRVAMNIGMDTHLFGAQAWQSQAVNTLYYFFKEHEGLNEGGICGSGYSQKYLQNGAPFGTCNTDNWRHGEGQIATNAAAAFASTNSTDANAFLNALWNDTWPTGTYRYYHGCLQMFGMLTASGNFKLYKPNQSESRFSETLQAEDFIAAETVQIGGTGDTGGGQVVGYIDTNDWLAYKAINIPATGQYTVEYRVASPNSNGQLSLTGPYGTPYYGGVSIPSTGGWDTYNTISHTVTLNEGEVELVIGVNNGGWNINWLKITQL